MKSEPEPSMTHGERRRLRSVVKVFLGVRIVLVVGLALATWVALRERGRVRKHEYKGPLLALAFTPTGDEIVTLERDVRGGSEDAGYVAVWRSSLL